MHRLDYLRFFNDYILPNLDKVDATHPIYNSGHEAYAVLQEEVDELWAEVKNKDQDTHRMFHELTDVTIVAFRWARLWLNHASQPEQHYLIDWVAEYIDGETVNPIELDTLRLNNPYTAMSEIITPLDHAARNKEYALVVLLAANLARTGFFLYTKNVPTLRNLKIAEIVRALRPNIDLPISNHIYWGKIALDAADRFYEAMRAYPNTDVTDYELVLFITSICQVVNSAYIEQDLPY